MRTSFGRGLWRLADPKISLASICSIVLGACAAARGGPLDGLWLTATVLGIFFIEVAKNASGEIVDFDSGTDAAVEPRDRSPFSGGKRVLIEALLTRSQTAWIAASGYGLGVATGVGIAAARESQVLWLGLVGVGCAFFYHAPPLKLAYRGLGELAVGLCYGPLICAGTYLVQRGQVSPEALWISIPYGMLVACFLLISEVPDFRPDRAARKRTLVVRFGRRRASRAFAVLVIGAFAVLAILPLAGLPRAVWLGGLAAAPALGAARRFWHHPEDVARLIPAQRLALLAFVLLALGAGLGLVLGAPGR